MDGKDYMITTIIKSKRGQAAFTLAEVMIAATLGTVVMAAVMSTFLLLGRSGANIANYSVMNAELRRGMEELAQDLRMASDIKWNSATSITLTVPDSTVVPTIPPPVNPTTVKFTYAWDSATSGATARCFYRKPGDAAASNPRTILVRNVATLSFARFNRVDATTPISPTVVTAANDKATKRIQVSMNVRTVTQTVKNATNLGVSASYILRNKITN